jgi:hypothetical protein
VQNLPAKAVFLLTFEVVWRRRVWIASMRAINPSLRSHAFPSSQCSPRVSRNQHVPRAVSLSFTMARVALQTLDFPPPHNIVPRHLYTAPLTHNGKPQNPSSTSQMPTPIVSLYQLRAGRGRSAGQGSARPYHCRRELGLDLVTCSHYSGAKVRNGLLTAFIDLRNKSYRERGGPDIGRRRASL